MIIRPMIAMPGRGRHGVRPADAPADRPSERTLPRQRLPQSGNAPTRSVYSHVTAAIPAVNSTAILVKVHSR